MAETKLQKLEDLPGIGKKIAKHLRAIGIKNANDLKGRNPKRLYEKLCSSKKSPPDRCLLYVLRCAINYLSHPKCNRQLLKWWNWKD